MLSCHYWTRNTCSSLKENEALPWWKNFAIGKHLCSWKVFCPANNGRIRTMVGASGRKALKFCSDTHFSNLLKSKYTFLYCLVLKWYLHLLAIFYKCLCSYSVASYILMCQVLCLKVQCSSVLLVRVWKL